jgi:hypothetical protein
MMLQYAGSADRQTEAGRHHLAKALWAVCYAMDYLYMSDDVRYGTREGNKVVVRCAQSLEYLLQQGAIIELKHHPWGCQMYQDLQIISENNKPTFAWINRTLEQGKPAKRSVLGHKHGDECDCDWPVFRPGMAVSFEDNASASSVGQRVISEDFLGEELHVDDETEWCMCPFDKHDQYEGFWKTRKTDHDGH